MDNTQQKVRHIPIFVEGRDQPVISRDQHDGASTGASANASAPPQNSANNTSAFASAESSSGPHHQSHFGRQPMNFGSDMGFGQEIPMPTGSIFDRAKDFPVRDFFNMRSASPRRSESPINAHHQQQYPYQQQQQQQQQSRNSPSPAGQQQQRQPTPQTQDRSVPIQHEARRSTTPQRQQAPPQGGPQPQQAPQVELSVPAKQKAIEDSITKIQKIQASVLDLMSRVEQFDGVDRKEYAWLDEMLTQNLIKLDDIDAEGKENIKNARREAIKCINSLISLLEAKKDEAAKAGGESRNQSEAIGTEQELPTQNGVNGTSRNSSYDNVKNVKQTPSNNSVNTNAEVSAEVSLEAKVQEAMQKQNE